MSPFDSDTAKTAGAKGGGWNRGLRSDLLDRLSDKFTIGDGCWEWTAGINNRGYGMVQTDGRTEPAHRVIYQLLGGIIPPGMHVDHLCRNRSCVRPSHLEPVTVSENQSRGMLGRDDEGRFC